MLRLRTAASVIVFGLLLAGCGPGKGASQPPGAATAPSSSDAKNSVAFDGAYSQLAPSPIQHYRLLGGESFDITTAEHALAEVCMRRYGFELVGPGYDRQYAIAEQREADLDQYGVNDVDRARAFGYREALAAPSPQGQKPAEGSEAYQIALVGFQVASQLKPGLQQPKAGNFLPAGCIGEARNRIWGQPTVPSNDVARGIYLGSGAKAEADSRVVELIAQWSSCMKSRGYEYAHPFDPLKTDWGAAGEDPELPADEINAAVADVECKRSVDLVPKWSAVVAEYETKGIEEHALELTEARAKIDEALKNANEVFAEGR